MAAFGDLHFDAYLIASRLKELIEQRSTLSMEELLNKARRLLPYVKQETGPSSWGPANKPEHILDGARLRLRAFVRNTPGIDLAYPDYETVEQIAALDRISRVVLDNADPAIVTSNIPRILADLRRPSTVFRKIRVGEQGGMLTIRFYRNDRFDVQYRDESSARKVAETLVSTIDNLQTS
jgi:hypothetical protein